MIPELSRRFAAERLGPGRPPAVVEVVATPAECRAVAARLMIPDVLALACRFALRWEAGRIVADGRLAARVARECVVSLDVFEADIAEDFTVLFVTGAEAERDGDDPLAPDRIAYEGDAIDLGEATVEQLALALEPYPRKPGVTAPATEADEAEPGHPFAALNRLRH